MASVLYFPFVEDQEVRVYQYEYRWQVSRTFFGRTGKKVWEYGSFHIASSPKSWSIKAQNKDTQKVDFAKKA